MHSGARLRRDNSNTIYQHLKTIGKFESHDSQRFKETRYIEFGVNNVRGLGLGDYCWGRRLDLKECCMLTRGQGIKMVPLTWIEIKLNWKKKNKKTVFMIIFPSNYYRQTNVINALQMENPDNTFFS